MTDDPVSLTRRLAAVTLSRGRAAAPMRVHDDACEEFFRYLSGHQLGGIASAAVDAGLMIVPEGQRERLRASVRDAMVWALTIERRLLEIAERFDDQRIEFVVVKGPALARAAYAEPEQRPFRDLDLLVRARDWDRASDTLVAMGFPRERPEPRRGFDARFGKAAVHTDATGVPVDLHRRLVIGPFGMWIDTDELFERTVPFDIAGYRLQRLDDTSLLIHACVHAVLGWWPPLPLALWDVAHTARLADVRWSDARVLATRWRLGGVLQFAFRLARSPDFGADLPVEAMAFENLVPSRTERKALASYTTERRSLGGMSRATLRAIPGVRDRIGYARSLIVPTRAFMAWRGRTGGEASYFRRWAMPVSWMRRRTRWARRHGRPKTVETKAATTHIDIAARQ